MSAAPGRRGAGEVRSGMGRAVLHDVVLDAHATLDDFASVAHLAGSVHELRAEAESIVPRLAGRTVWMVNSR